jgi:hypothetical protein
MFLKKKTLQQLRMSDFSQPNVSIKKRTEQTTYGSTLHIHDLSNAQEYLLPQTVPFIIT